MNNPNPKSRGDEILEEVKRIREETKQEREEWKKVLDKIGDKAEDVAEEVVEEVVEEAQSRWRQFREYLRNNNAAENTVIVIVTLFATELFNAATGRQILLPIIKGIITGG